MGTRISVGKDGAVTIKGGPVEVAAKKLDRLGPKARAVADRVREQGYLDREAARVGPVLRWWAAECVATRGPLVTAGLKPGRSRGSLSVVTILMGTLDDETASEVLALMKAEGRASRSVAGFNVEGIPAARLDPLAAAVAARLAISARRET